MADSRFSSVRPPDSVAPIGSAGTGQSVAQHRGRPAPNHSADSAAKESGNGRPPVGDIVERLRRRAESWEHDGELAPDCVDAQWDREGADEIDRLRREVLELRGVIRAHEGMYERAAEEIDRLRGWLERTYRMAVGHGPNWKVFDGWEEAIDAYEEARRG